MRHLFFTSLLLLNLVSINAQEPTLRNYATQKWMHGLIDANPAFQNQIDKIERFTYDYKYSGTIDTVTVAVVFHLFPLPGNKQMPSNADVQAQIGRLVTDFYQPAHPYLSSSYQNPGFLEDLSGVVSGSESNNQVYLNKADNKAGFAQRAGNPVVHFCIAGVDVNGQPTDGVLLQAGIAKEWTIDGSLFDIEKGGSKPWDPNLYCNIYVARLEHEIAGYAQRPGFSALTDGIVIDDRFFAKEVQDNRELYSTGKTLSHLMGSYLNLHELWNEYVPCGDDFVDDTPIHNASNAGLSEMAYQYMHVSTCDGNPVEMFSNLMDDAPDSLQYLFTWGQVIRMQATLSEKGPRGQLRKTPVTCNVSLVNNPSDRAIDNDSRNSNSKLFSTRAYPNPTSGRITLEIDSKVEGQVEIQILSTSGNVFQKINLEILKGANYQEIDATDWNPGLYAIVVLLDGKVSTTRFMLEKL